MAALLAAGFLLGAPGGVRHATAAPGFRVIVHPETPADRLDAEFLEDVFLKKVTRWPNGDLVRPVDQRPNAGVRRSFSEEVVGRSVPAVKSYWQQRIFSGRDVPPPELRNDAEVVEYVLRHPGAIGYVSRAADVRGAKVVTVD